MFLLVALVALLASGAFFVSRRREARTRAAAQRASARAMELTACVLGEAPLPRDVTATSARLRRIALSPTTPATWPSSCAPMARAVVDESREHAPLTRLSERAAALSAALMSSSLAGEIQGFREGRNGLSLDAVAAPLRALSVEAGLVASSFGRVRPARARDLPRPLAALGGDLIPVSIAQGSVVAGTNLAAGTLSALFIEPTRERVFCRSRDRGATWSCRRFAREGSPQYLIASDDPEAVSLVESPAGTASFAPIDALAQPVFTIAKPLVSSLPARLVGGSLLAVTADGVSSVLQRCARGGACVEAPLGAPARLESVIARAANDTWWIGVTGEAASLSLDARSVPAAPAALGAVTHITELRSPSTLLTSCHADGVSYVAAVDAPGTHLFALEAGHAPRSLGSMNQAGLPFELVCDSEGATLVGGNGAQSCRRSGGCAPKLTFDVPRRFARVGGELVMVSIARDGDGLRVRHGDPMNFHRAPTAALDDDAAHGGLSARSLWLLSAGDRLALFATGATTAALWSDDRGASWHPASEAFECSARPARRGSLR